MPFMSTYDKAGNPITDEVDFYRLFKDESYKRFAFTEFTEKGITISTVWLGFNHNFFDKGPPLIFETMVFGGSFDEHQWRYATEKEAIEGHQKAVDLVKLELKYQND